jgi:hypothetical protein
MVQPHRDREVLLLVKATAEPIIHSSPIVRTGNCRC